LIGKPAQESSEFRRLHGCLGDRCIGPIERGSDFAKDPVRNQLA
jgi:hypothetical protein